MINKQELKTVTVTGASAILKVGAVAQIAKVDNSKNWLVVNTLRSVVQTKAKLVMLNHATLWLVEGRDFNF